MRSITTDVLDDDHPLFLINEQIKGLLEGLGAGEDHEDVLAFLRNTGLPESTATCMHRALVGADKRFEVQTELLSVLREIIGQENPNRWGYDAAHVAMDDGWRARARAAYARATGQEIKP